MNLNGKNALVIGGSAALAGAFIYGGTKAFGWIKSNRAPKEQTDTPKVHVVQVAEDAPLKKMKKTEETE